MQTPKDALKPIVRVQQNLLAAAERRFLTWLCSRMPAWVTPDRLTATGVFGAVLVFGGYVASHAAQAWLYLSIVGYVIHWFGDSMDGSIARYRRIERPAFGYFIDHSCDAFATLLILVGIGLSPFVRLDVALSAVVGYLLLCIHAFLSVRVLGEMQLSYLSAGPTELRLMLIGLTFAMMILGHGPGLFTPISGFDLWVGAISMLLVILFIVQTTVTARRLAGSEGEK